MRFCLTQLCETNYNCTNWYERRDENGQLSTVVSLYNKKRITLEEAAEELSITVEEFEDKLRFQG